MKIYTRIVLLLSVLGMLASCAEDKDDNYIEIQQASLDAWMAKYVNAYGEVASKLDKIGMYIEVLEEGQGGLATNDTTVWVRLNITGRDLHNNVYYTRSEEIARQQGTFDEHTHYVPEYLYCGSINSNMIAGQYFALKDTVTIHGGAPIKLTEGSKVRLYLPSWLAYGSSGTSNDVGYGGQFSLKGDVPTILDMEVVTITKDPEEYEEKQVDDYLAAHADQDWTLVNDTLPYLYVDKKFRLADDAEAYTGDSIHADSIVKVWYVGKFLDGFVFDTNIDSVQTRLYGKPSDSNNFFQPDSSVDGYKVGSEGVISGWEYALQELRYGQWAKLVFTSEYGYGITGVSATNPNSSSSSSSNYYYYNNLYSSLYDYNYGYGYGGYGYGYGGYGYGYDNYYDYYSYYNYQNYLNSLYSQSSTTTTTTQSITTEIQSYTPLVFEIYIETNQDSGDSDDEDEDD